MRVEVRELRVGERERGVGTADCREAGFRTRTMAISKSSSAAAVGDVPDRRRTMAPNNDPRSGETSSSSSSECWTN